MNISLIDIKNCIIKEILKRAEIDSAFLQEYIIEYDVNFDLDLDEMLEDFKLDINTFIDDNIFGIEDYQRELKEE